MISKPVKLALQLVISVGLIVFIARQIDLEQARALLARGAGWGWVSVWLLLALAVFNLSRVAGALRLNVYQRQAGVILGAWENLRLYYAGMFLNMFLPGGIGGDGYKILVLRRRQAASVGKLFRILLTDRVSGLLVLLMLFCPLLWRLDLPWQPALVTFAAVALLLSAALAFVVVHALWFPLAKAVLGSVFAYGMAVQLLQLSCMAALLAFLQVAPAHYLAYLAIFLLSSVAAVLPLSFGGLGAREVTFFFGLDLLHLEPTQGVLAASAFFLITLVSSLPGSVFLRGFGLGAGVRQA